MEEPEIDKNAQETILQAIKLDGKNKYVFLVNSNRAELLEEYVKGGKQRNFYMEIMSLMERYQVDILEEHIKHVRQIMKKPR